MYAAPTTTVAKISNPSKYTTQYSAHIVTGSGKWTTASFDTRKEAVAYINELGAEILTAQKFSNAHALRTYRGDNS